MNARNINVRQSRKCDEIYAYCNLAMWPESQEPNQNDCCQSHAHEATASQPLTQVDSKKGHLSPQWGLGNVGPRWGNLDPQEWSLKGDFIKNMKT